MRTRSSRLFWVLVHLVGVSTDEPLSLTNSLAIVLERTTLAQSLDDDATLSHPFWLQDTDGSCFTPVGTFSSCGDATLWYIRPIMINHDHQDNNNSNKRVMSRRAARRARSRQTLGYALELFHDSNSCLLAGKQLQQSQSQQQQKNHHYSHGRSKPFKIRPNSHSSTTSTSKKNILAMGSCTAASSLDSVFGWMISEYGVLYKLGGKLAHSKECLWQQPQQQPLNFALKDDPLTMNSTSTTIIQPQHDAVFAPCVFTSKSDDTFSKKENNDLQRRLVHLTLTRHEPASVSQERERVKAELAEQKKKESEEQARLEKEKQRKDAKPDNTTTATITTAPEEGEHIPRSKDLARAHASEPLQHAKVKTVGGSKSTSTSSSSKTSLFPQKLFTLKDTNPILFHGDRLEQQAKQRKNLHAGKDSMGGTSTTLHSPRRRMQTHPYLITAENEVWTDPQTGLSYPTDLCHYLGHDRKTAGRHTLTGVGYYTRTVLNIKVYGVALYVAKRDLLADSKLEPYATMTADELRQNMDFYNHLRQMPSADDPTTLSDGFLVDRTILLKLNMQLSMETMQSSLHATWKLLTEERKHLLINSSMKARPAEERMLQTIASPSNPGRCSCGQVAPPEYRADRDCCARGTELVFTWRKNGDLEIRVDGRIMDSFPRPDVARGIFYEYLRVDDPIAPDFTQRVVDGFPFLLGPLAQMKGMNIQMNDAMPPKAPTKNTNFADYIISSHAGDFVGWVATGAVSNVANAAGNVVNAATNVAHAAKNVGDAARTVAEELDRRRDQLWNQVTALPEIVSTLPDAGKQFLQRRLTKNNNRPDELAASVAHYMRRRYAPATNEDDNRSSNNKIRGRVFRNAVSYWFGVDGGETTSQPNYFERLLCLYVVHLYLLLILIVSLPSSTQHTKFVRTTPTKGIRHKQLQEDASPFMDDDDSSSTESSSIEESPSDWTIGRRQRRSNGQSHQTNGSPTTTGMKKSLSYYL